MGRVLGTTFDVLFNQPSRWVVGGGFVKYVVLGLTLYAAWHTLRGQDGNGALERWLPPSLSRSDTTRYRFRAPDIPAADIAELSARLQSIENVLSGLSVEHERARSKLENEMRARGELVGRLGTLEERVREVGEREMEMVEVERWKSQSENGAKGLEAVRREVEVLQELVKGGVGAGVGTDGAGSDEEARVKLKALEERVGNVEGGVKEALVIGKHSVKAGGTSNAWWNKLTTAGGRSGLTIKSTDGQDVTSLIGHLVDSAVSQYGKDVLARPDFALHSAGAKTIPSLTTETFEIRPQNFPKQLLGLITGNGYAIGRPPVTALHHELHNGHCWPFKGSEGMLGVLLAAPVIIEEVTIDHVAKEVAFDLRSAPREMEVWGMVEGWDNVAKVRMWEDGKIERRRKALEDGVSLGEEEEERYPKGLPRSPQYIRLASFTYDIHSPKNIQTFPVDEEIRALGVDFGVVVLVVKNNWGQDVFTCLYRFRVHGQRLGEVMEYPEDV